MAESHRCMFFFSENIQIRVVVFQVSYAANLRVSGQPFKMSIKPTGSGKAYIGYLRWRSASVF